MSTVKYLHVCLALSFCYTTVLAVIVSPCKVQNLVIQPTHGTSLKTKGLVNILQVPPVFVQNVLVGICENRNQNGSRMGELYICQQRYSAVELYIAEPHELPGGNIYQQNTTPDNLNTLKFIRESVIIESGCDFGFNLLPLVASTQNQAESQVAQIQQQRMILKSPYHNSIPTKQSVQQAETGIPFNHQPQITENQARGATNNNNDAGVGTGSSSSEK